MGTEKGRKRKNFRIQEKLTAYDDDWKPIGDYPRSYVHRNSMWHSVVQCWLIGVRDQEIRLFMQRRSYEKRSHPGKYDITAGGHVMAGERPEEAMVRELKEETGIIMRPESLIEVGRLPEVSGRDHEIAHIYLSIQHDPPFRPGEEVVYMISADIEEFRELMEGARDSIEVTPAIRTGPMLDDVFTVGREGFCEHDSFLKLVYPFIMDYLKPYFEEKK